MNAIKSNEIRNQPQKLKMNKLLVFVVASCLVSMACAQININFNFNNEQNFAQNFEQLGNIFSNWNQGTF